MLSVLHSGSSSSRRFRSIPSMNFTVYPAALAILARSRRSVVCLAKSATNSGRYSRMGQSILSPRKYLFLRATEIRIYTCEYASCGSFPDSLKRSRVDNHNLSFQLSGIPYRCRCSSAPLPVVDSQQCSSSFYQPMVPVDHTPIVILMAHILYRISLLQDQVIPLLC